MSAASEKIAASQVFGTLRIRPTMAASLRGPVQRAVFEQQLCRACAVQRAHGASDKELDRALAWLCAEWRQRPRIIETLQQAPSAH
jgi:hypothetical protein